jgi:Holliday junction resolvase RusA-like endonuclease
MTVSEATKANATIKHRGRRTGRAHKSTRAENECSKQRKKKKMVRVEDMMEIAGADPFDKALSFVVIGDPPVQKRHRIAWRHVLACAWKKNNHRRNPIIYDPSAKEKVAFRSAVRAAMEEIAIATFPYFQAKQPLVLVVGFASIRPHVFQAFPHSKDLDNLVKFVMDACHDVLYENDNVVVRLVAEKNFVPVGAAGASTKVEFRTRPTSI